MPDKAQPHAAAVFMRDTVPGKLTIRWAVFLPVDEHEESVPIDPRMGGYSLTLHGHFFADAGRNGLYGLDDSGDSVPFRQRRSADSPGVERCVGRGVHAGSRPPRASLFLRDTQDGRGACLRAEWCYQELEDWAKWKASIAANHKWLRLVTPEGFRWALISDERTLPLPAAPEKDPGRPWRVFPWLAGLGNHVVLFDPLADNLVARDSDLGSWEEDEAVELIASIDAARTFDSSVDADYAAAS